MLTKAMIMAAGVGSRLEPLSSVVPKPLVPLANVPTMDILLKHLAKSGIKDVIANTFFKAEHIQNYYKQHNFNININFIKETELSGTAGGVKKCQFFFEKGQDFIVMSGDGLTDLNIHDAYEAHKKSGSIITIVTKEVEHKEVSKYGIIVTDEKGYVHSFQEKPSMAEAKSNLANTGIYIFNYKIFEYIPENTFYDFAKNVFPSVLKEGTPINTYTLNGYWSDIGSIEQYKQSNRDIIDGKVSSIKPNIVKTLEGKYTEGRNFERSIDCAFQGNNVFGHNCKIGKNCRIKNSVLWDNVVVADGMEIENSIILPNLKVDRNIVNSILSKTEEKEKQPV